MSKKVIHENILVHIPEPKKAPGGIIMPDEEKDDKLEGVIVSCGGAVPERLKTFFAKENVSIRYKKFYDGEEFDLEDGKYIVMNYKDILLIL
jgi:co-chaperonin GroES (HSP10)